MLAASARALELQHMEPQILEKIATYFGYAAVTRIHLTQTSSALLRKEAKPAPKRKADPDNRLAALAAQCEDESLRNALLSLARTMDAVEN